MASEAPAPDAQLGEKNLSTIHAVAQALAIGPMFSVALVLGAVSSPVNGAGVNTALAVLLAGLGVLAIGYALSIHARRYAGVNGTVISYDWPTYRTSIDRSSRSRLPRKPSARNTSNTSRRNESAAASPTAQPTRSACGPPTTKSTSTTSTPRSCTCSASITNG